MIKLTEYGIIKITVSSSGSKSSLFYQFLTKINWIDIDQDHIDIFHYYMEKQ